MDLGLHGSFRPSERSRGLGGGEPVDVAEDDGRPRGGRQLEQGRRESMTGLPAFHHGRRTGLGARDGLETSFDERLERAGGMTIGHAAPAVPREVDGDGGEPRPEPQLADPRRVVAGQGAVGPRERVLGYLLGIAG